jgi:acetyl-CoA carboxylase biotin carboxyl carrier protein
MSEKNKGIDQALIRDLANILNETDLTEIEIEQNDLRIRVSRAGTPQYVQATAPAPAPVAAPVAAAPVASVEAPSVRDPKNVVSAPMVGTCYLCPAPGTPPFVGVGSMVKEGQTLLIIEAMKTMNQIPAPRAGKIVEVIAEDGQPVEYGQPLFVIE